MAILTYRQAGLVLTTGSTADRQGRDLQPSLRALGYLKGGIDGNFGDQTELAVKGLQHDLLHNNGGGSDGSAPVRMTDINKGRVTQVTGQVDQNLVECISDLLDDTQVPRLPSTPDPRAENRKIIAEIAPLSSPKLPIPFLIRLLHHHNLLKP